jgi:probable F420-dependent oxidoreductase
MEFWQAIAFTEPDQLVDFARTAEEFGFDGVTCGDHFVTPAQIESSYPYTADRKPWVQPDGPLPDPLLLTAALAQVTTRLRFLATAYILPMRHPVAAAKAIATAAVLSKNRLVLGVGVGWMKEEFDTVDEEFRTRGRRCDEGLAIVRKLLGGGMVEHHGEFYDFPLAQMCPVPDRPVPVLIAGHSEVAFRRVARWDGWIGAHYELDEIPGHMKAYDEALARAGRTGAPRQAIVALNRLEHPDELRRLEDVGITGVIQMPLAFQGLKTTRFDEKRASMERFAERFIAPLRR